MSTLLADLEARDARDMNRSTAPLKPAEDSLQLDSSEMTIEEVVAQVLRGGRNASRSAVLEISS
jgi:3-phosphoshikimate 1-carboxyvinyltransferase